MLFRFIVYSFIILSLHACVKHKPIAQNSVRLIPWEGLVKEAVFDKQVYIKLQGNPAGPAIVLIHGLGDNASRIWDQTIRKLETQYFLLTLDLPGFGKSPKTNALYSPENYARLIRTLSQNYLGKPFHLVGHSMGGAISLRYAATYPQDIQSLTLVDAAGILHRLAYTQYLAPLGLKQFAKFIEFDRKDVSSVAGYLLNKAENMMRLDPKLLIEDSRLRARVLRANPAVISGLALVLDDFSEMPAKVSAPTQIIWGENDEVAPLRTGHLLSALIENSTLNIIPQAGHNPIIEKPAAFHQLLIASIGGQKKKLPAQKINQPKHKTVRCSHQNNVCYSGTIKKLSINNCKNVFIQNADIEQLLIFDSRVFLRATHIQSSQTALTAKRSLLEITAGSIKGKIAIETDASRLDIAGTQLSGEQAIIKALSRSSAVFSASSKSANTPETKILHGQIVITPDQPLLYGQ